MSNQYHRQSAIAVGKRHSANHYAPAELLESRLHLLRTFQPARIFATTTTATSSVALYNTTSSKTAMLSAAIATSAYTDHVGTATFSILERLEQGRFETPGLGTGNYQ